MAQIKVTQEIVDSIGLSRPKLIEMIRAGKIKGEVTDKTIMIDESEIPSSAKPTPVNPQTGEIQMTPKEKAQGELDAKRLQLDLKVVEDGFKNLEDFKTQKANQVKQQVELDNRKAELDKREDGVKTREDLVTQRESQVAESAKLNDAVRESIKNREIEDYKKAKALREFAFMHYFENLDTLFQKIVNCRNGKNCYGIITRNNRRYDEPVVMDEDFREELIDIINQILPVLKVSPKFDKDTGEYLRQDQIEEPNEEEPT